MASGPQVTFQPDRISAYYRQVARQLWLEFRPHMKAHLLGIAAATVGVYALAYYKINPDEQTSTRMAAAAVWSLIALPIYLMVAALRSPWKLHNDVRRDHDGQLRRIEETHREIMEEIRRVGADTKTQLQISQGDLAAKDALIRNLEGQIADLRGRLRAPRVTLTWQPVPREYRYGGTIPLEQSEMTEFLASCTGGDAFGILIEPTCVGTMADNVYTLQSRVEKERLAAGSPAKLQYALLFGPSGNEAVSDQYLGRLTTLFDSILRENGEVDMLIPIRLNYTDDHGDRHTSDLELYYHPRVEETPLFRIRTAAEESQRPERRRNQERIQC